MSSLRDSILSKPRAASVPVPVPEWDTTIYIRPLTATELSTWAIDNQDNPDSPEGSATRMADLIVRCAVDEQGVPIFQEGDAAQLTEKDAAPLQRLGRKAQQVNGIGAEAEAKAAKKLGTPSGDSSAA